MAQLGRIPMVGDNFECQNLRFEVMDMDGHRVDKVLIMPKPSTPDSNSGKDVYLFQGGRRINAALT